MPDIQYCGCIQNNCTNVFSRSVYVVDLFCRSLCCYSYRSAEEVKAVRKEEDPIKQLETYAEEGNLATEEELKVRCCCL